MSEALQGRMLQPGDRMVYIWDEKKSVAAAGEVVMKFTWKTGKDKKPAFATRFLSAPEIKFSLSGDYADYSDFLTDSFGDFQRTIIQKLITEQLEAGSFHPIVPAEYFDREELLELWEAQEASKGKGRGKLSKAQIEEFFDGSVRDILVLTVAEKLGFDDASLQESENVQKLNQLVNTYRSMMGKLAEQEPIEKVNLIQIKKAWELAEIKTGIGGKIGRKIEKLLQPKGVNVIMEQVL